MTVAELKKQLEKYPDTMDVFIRQDNTEFELSLVEQISNQNVLFSEGDGNQETEAYEDVIIISDY